MKHKMFILLLISCSIVFQSCAIFKGNEDCQTKSYNKFIIEYSLDLNAIEEELIYQKKIECDESYNSNAIAFLLSNIFVGNEQKPLGTFEIAFLIDPKNKEILSQIIGYSRTEAGKTEDGLMAIAIYAGLAAHDALEELNTDAESFLSEKIK